MSTRPQFDPRIAKPIRTPLDTSRLAFPKPGARAKAQPKDGRLIESLHRYRITKRAMWEQQSKRCVRVEKGKLCGKFMPTPAYGHRHHPGGRGLGGGKRDDSKTVLICVSCHLAIHARRAE